MCDTAGKIVNDHQAIFAKNSDRSANEPQVIEYVPHKIHEESELKCTYISIEQVRETNAMVLSRPVWLWGAEMGVNEHGVCIGNEAVFTKGRYGDDALIGMDLLRLGLERGNTAREALEVIIALLEKYGQGGNCGYDKDFHYDNSYLIMDRKEIYVLETAGKDWAYKKSNHASISNRLSLGDDCDACSGDRCDFKRKYSDLIFSTFSQAANRRNTTICHKLDSVNDAFDMLRTHSVRNSMSRGSVSSVCMHAGNMFADQTTSSMVVELGEQIKIFVTGSSRPCLSIFKPYDFKTEGIIFPEGDKDSDSYWKNMEIWQRSLLGMIIPEDYYLDKAQLEKEIMLMDVQEALAKEQEFIEKWQQYHFENDTCAIGFRSFWDKKNKAFYEEKQI